MPYPIIQYPWDRRDFSIQHLPEPLNQPDLVVFHSTYIPVHAKLAAWCHKHAIPYLICPRGGMTRRAQRVKRLKKIAGNILFFNQMVRNAAALHFLTTGEADASQRWQKAYLVASNGVDLPANGQLRHSPDVNLSFVFVGRLDIYIKGLDLFLEGCSLARTELLQHNVHIGLFGPDSSGDKARLGQLISKYDLGRLVSLGNAVHGDAKKRILSQADLFIHTSRFEGHPTAVLEALSFGVPCLLTPETNMASIVREAGAGWETEPAASAIAETLVSILASPQQLGHKRLQARQLIEREYTWERIARCTLNEYDKVLRCVLPS
jgi:glycosyltransferase involved in cell wall biosynthesis